MTKCVYNKRYPDMVCTSVQVYKPAKQDKEPYEKGYILARARIVLNEQFQLTGLNIIEGKWGLFVNYPVDPNCDEDNNYSSMFYPLTKELRDEIEMKVLKQYELFLEGAV